MAAGCLPVVVANRLSGAFASHVPYGRFWIRVDEKVFVAKPTLLLELLRRIPPAEVLARRARMLRHVADVTYGPGSRVASNFLRAADEGCLRGITTPTLGIYPHTHKYAADDKWGLNCSCVRQPPSFFWASEQTKWTRGDVPTEVCRCLHCATLCPREGG
jgi:hypothetical protein